MLWLASSKFPSAQNQYLPQLPEYSMNISAPIRSAEQASATNSTGTRQSAATGWSRKTKLLLLLGGVALVSLAIGFFFWWRPWAWGNRVFAGPRGKLVIQYKGRRVYALRREVLAEAQTRFTYAGKPIHPAIVNAFSSWSLDSATTVLAVDVAGATGSNQYGQQVETYETGFHEIVLEVEPDTGRESTFGYLYLGTLESGVQVLMTVECGGGTGRFGNLLLLRCEVASIGGQDRLLLKYVDHFALGDRFGGEITLQGDRIAIDTRSFIQYTGLQESTVFHPKLGRW